MKNIATLLVAILFTAGMSFAQNNEASVEQDGLENDAVVGQTGSGNTAEILQGFMGAQQHDATASISQDGNDNEAEINQRGGARPGNNHSISQSGGDENKARLRAFSAENIGSAEQIGSLNDAFLRQFSFENEAYFSQQGDKNVISGYQAGGENLLDVSQDGVLNTAEIEQLQGENTAFVTQVNVNPLGEVGHFAAINQDGVGNSTTLTQGLSDDDGSSYRENTYGSGNLVVAVQGHYAQMRLDLNGDVNTITSRQERVGYASIIVTGDDNTFELDQLSGSGFLGATITGGENTITVLQDGARNDIMKDGSGWWQRDGIVIDGDLNTVGITQLGSDHRANVFVAGDGNAATIMQSN